MSYVIPGLIGLISYLSLEHDSTLCAARYGMNFGRKRRSGGGYNRLKAGKKGKSFNR